MTNEFLHDLRKILKAACNVAECGSSSRYEVAQALLWCLQTAVDDEIRAREETGRLMTKNELQDAIRCLEEALQTQVPMSAYAESRIRRALAILRGEKVP